MPKATRQPKALKRTGSEPKAGELIWIKEHPLGLDGDGHETSDASQIQVYAVTATWTGWFASADTLADHLSWLAGQPVSVYSVYDREAPVCPVDFSDDDQLALGAYPAYWAQLPA